MVDADLLVTVVEGGVGGEGGCGWRGASVLCPSAPTLAGERGILVNTASRTSCTVLLVADRGEGYL